MSEPGNFWTKRRAGVAAEAEAELAAERAEVDAQAMTAREAQSDEEILAELELPEPESLQKGDDFSAFLSKEVPERLRKRALRVLWRSNPILACVAGLNDYDDDFTNAATDAPGVKTAYQVGKGLLAHVEKMAADAEAKARPQLAKEASEPEPETEPETEPEIYETKVLDQSTQSEDRVDVREEAQPMDATPVQRRMKFAFAAGDSGDAA